MNKNNLSNMENRQDKYIKPINNFTKNGKLFGILFRSNLGADGVNFLTPHEYPLQVAVIGHRKKKHIKKHAHNPTITHEVDYLQEFLYLEKGEVEVTIYDHKDWSVVAVFRLHPGDFYLHIDGGHGFKIIKKCRLIEVKQGPYPGDKLAKIFDPSDK